MRVVVVGGGLVGASAAYRLARRGVSVTVVDAAAPGRASAAGAGMLPALDHFSAEPAMLPLLRAARAHYGSLLQQLAEDGQHDTGYARVGALQLALNDGELSALGEHQRRARALDGFAHVGDVSMLDAEEARRHLPVLSPTLRGALYASGAARVDGRKLLSALLRATTSRGGRQLRARVRLVRRGSRVWLDGEAGRLDADAVLVSAGAWSARLAEAVGVRLSVRPQRGQLLHLDCAGAPTERWPIAIRSPSNYLLAFPGGRVVVGATREDDAGFDAASTEAGIDRVRRQALELAPSLGGAATLDVRVGFRPVTPDGLPVLGAVRGLESLGFATGHGGYGIEVGPYSGALVADGLLGDEPPWPLDAYAPDRTAPERLR